MKNISEIKFGIILIVLFITLIGGCSGEVLNTESSWMTNEINLGGDIENWEEVGKLVFEEEGINLGFANDSSYIYAILYFRNRRFAHLIGISGLKVWINNDREKNKNYGFSYKGAPDLPEGQREMDTVINKNDEMFKNRIRDKMQFEERLEIIDENGKLGGLIAADGSMGIKILPGYKNGFFIYEFRIPLMPSKNGWFTVNADVGDTLLICLETEELTPLRKEGSGGRPPGGPSGAFEGKGGRPGGGRPGGGRGRPDIENLSIEIEEIWIELVLSGGK